MCLRLCPDLGSVGGVCGDVTFGNLRFSLRLRRISSIAALPPLASCWSSQPAVSSRVQPCPAASSRVLVWRSTASSGPRWTNQTHLSFNSRTPWNVCCDWEAPSSSQFVHFVLHLAATPPLQREDAFVSGPQRRGGRGRLHPEGGDQQLCD